MNSAIEDQGASEYTTAIKLMIVFEIDEVNNQQYLYYAASNYHSGEVLDKAMEGYENLWI